MLLQQDMICQMKMVLLNYWIQYANKIGLDKIKVIHLNDSKGQLGSNLDRHYHIGIGKIGEEGFKILINNKKFKIFLLLWKLL